jgi:hypothetical protein
MYFIAIYRTVQMKRVVPVLLAAFLDVRHQELLESRAEPNVVHLLGNFG